MNRYRIQLRTDTHVRQSLTIERQDYGGLKTEVARFIGTMLTAHANEVWTDQEWRVDVTDDAGLILYFMQISAHETAATMSKPATGL